MKITKPVAEYADRYQVGPLVGVTKAVAGIKGAFAVLHGVDGCTFAANQMRSAGPVVAGNYMPVAATGAERSEIILGDNEEMVMNIVRSELSEARTKPQLIFVLTSCATSIIHDDIVRIADVMQEETGIQSIPVDTGGFLGGYNWGAEQVWNAILSRYVPQPATEHKGLNLVGPHLLGSKNWPNDIREIERLLQAAEVPVNMTVFRNVPADQLPNMGKAAYNYTLTQEEFPDFKSKCNELGMPIWAKGQELPLPLGVHNTEEWLMAIAREFGNEEKAKAQMTQDMNLVKSIMRGNYNASWALGAMSSKHVAIYGYATFAASLARCLFYDFNMRPVLIALCGETPESLTRAEKLLEPMEGLLDFEVMENPSFYAYGEKIKEHQPELAVGMLQDRVLAEGLGVPHRSLGGFYFYNQFNFVPWPLMGIRGTLGLTSELWEVTDRVMSASELWKSRAYRNRDVLAEVAAAAEKAAQQIA
ncbi:MAG: nitrogenase component 1 [Chloroflexi bacterium]|nr:nitrogenase component 1 [Chloroflexota bacterium]